MKILKYIAIGLILSFTACSKSTDDSSSTTTSSSTTATTATTSTTTSSTTSATTSSTTKKRYVKYFTVTKAAPLDEKGQVWDKEDSSEPDYFLEMFDPNTSQNYKSLAKYNKAQADLPVDIGLQTAYTWFTGASTVTITLFEASTTIGNRAMSTWSNVNLSKSTTNPVKLTLNENNTTDYEVLVYWNEK